MGRSAIELTLTDEERSELRGWARRPSTAQAHAMRARIILACAQGANNGEVAEELGVTRQTVGTWRRRFVERRLAVLTNRRLRRASFTSTRQLEAAVTAYRRLLMEVIGALESGGSRAAVPPGVT